MNEIYCLKIDTNLADNDIYRLKKFITEENNNRLQKLKFKVDVLRTLYGELLVRFAVSKKLNIEPTEIIISRDNFNKPYFPDLPLYFNISHSGNYVISAVSDQAIGIDIEQITDIDVNFAQKIFARDEWERLNQLAESKRKLSFLIYGP